LVPDPERVERWDFEKLPLWSEQFESDDRRKRESRPEGSRYRERKRGLEASFGSGVGHGPRKNPETHPEPEMEKSEQVGDMVLLLPELFWFLQNGRTLEQIKKKVSTD